MLPLLGLFLVAAVCFAEKPAFLRVLNHQDYSIQLPVTLRGVSTTANSLSDGTTVQRDGSNLVFVANLPAKGKQDFTFRESETAAKKLISIKAAADGVELNVAGKEAGRLTWDLVIQPVKKKSSDGDIVSSKADYAKIYSAVSLSFEKTGNGAVFDTWKARGAKSGLALAVELKVFHAGFLDVFASITNESAATSNVSGALVCRWEHPSLEKRTLCYDNRRRDFSENTSTDFHEVEGRHWHVQHGVDWVRSQIKGGPSVVWINPFDPVFTVKAAATEKSPERFYVGSQSQYGREAQSIPGAFFAVTEIARGNLKSYRDRVREHVLPPKGEGFTITTRIAFQDKESSDDEADQLFLGTTSYREQETTSEKCEVVFGFPGVRFGTSYFPYSTLGENFDNYKLPGMDREGFWPLAADTVEKWPLFADEIRRDLRLAKWMGFNFIRLHHVELLAPIEKKIRQEYLDFLFDEMRHLGQQALLDIYISPEQVGELLKRYGDVIEGVEVENEILIWNLPANQTEEWSELYKAVKKSAPHVKVHWTAQNNTGIFDRLAQEGVGFDRFGIHSYVDTLEALPSARGWALAVADYGTRIGKRPTVTEWNYRGLTRMSPDDRAKIYPKIFEGALATRSIPEFYQFQFQETLAPNPVIGRGNLLRHYEIFNLSRHPKREAFEFAKIIQRHTAEDDPARMLTIEYSEAELNNDGNGTAKVKIVNQSSVALELKAGVEASAEFKAELIGATKISLQPQETKTIQLKLAAAGKKIGFHHAFIRFEGANGFLRYAAIEARLPGVPAFESSAGDEAKFPFEKLFAVVYGQDAPVIEVETAIAIAQTLESATGRLVPYFQMSDLPADKRASGNLFLVGTAATHELIKEVEANLPAEKPGVARVAKEKGEWLVVWGKDSEAAKNAGMDFILSYWKSAKDSAARRVGFVQKKLPRGIDPAKLP